MNKKQFKENLLHISYDEYKNSVPEIVDVFSISSYSYALYGGYYNFKLVTPKQKAYFGVYHSCMCDSDDIWDFLEELCDDDFKITSWFIDLEGYGPDIIAEDVGNGNIRLTITNYKWEEFYYDKDLDIVNTENKTFPDYKEHIQLDIIVNKRKFIYHFYLEMLYIFDKSVYKNRLDDICRHGYTEYYKARYESEKLAKYLGFTECNDLDRKLYRLIGGIEYKKNYKDVEFATLEEIEECLKEGANPNAIIIDECNEKVPIFNQVFNYYPIRLFNYRLDRETKYHKYKRYSKQTEIREKFKKEHYKEVEKMQRDVTNLLLKYGAKTYYGMPEISDNILECLLENGCKITSNLRKAMLLEDKSFIELFNKYKCLSSYRWID